ncbi:MAG TPA: Ig-like domain-containing protein, partial [Gemmatimonadales bacterium]|nr:Ig-like domain-containing protein [Gemmatimonadales bacterium]
MRSVTARRRRRLALAALVVAGIGVGCSDESAIGPGAVVTVRIVPDTIRLVLGKVDTARAFPLDQAGGYVVNKHATWASDDPLVATVDSAGLVTGMAVGMTQITASVGGIQGSAPVMVSPAPLIGLGADSLKLTSIAQSGGTPSGTIGISNAGGSTLDNLSLGTIAYSGTATGWITASLDQATAPATLTVDANTGGLALGTYSATIPIQAPSAPNSPQNVTVVLTLTPGAATTMAVSAGDNQTAQANATVAVPPAV